MTTASKHFAACTKYKKNFLEENGYLFCQVCGVSNAFKFEVHHIYYASRVPKHPNLHDERNLILICDKCHNKFHGGEYKEQFAKLEAERGLKELFK